METLTVLRGLEFLGASMSSHRSPCPLGKEVAVTVHVGDRIRLESERPGQSGKAGLIEEVLSEQPQRLRVRWEDGRTSILAPAAGVAHIESAASPRRRKRPTA